MSLTAADEDDEQPQFDIPADEASGPEQQLARSELRRAVVRGLDQLPDDARRILILRELDGCPMPRSARCCASSQAR